MIYVVAILLLGILIVLVAMYTNRDGINERKDVNPNLHFKNNIAAFQYACEFLNQDLRDNTAYIGIVEDSKVNDNAQECVVKIAVNGGQSYVFGFTNKNNIKLTKGQLVLWGLMDRVSFGDNIKIIAAGYILAIIEPSVNVKTGKWVVKQDLT